MRLTDKQIVTLITNGKHLKSHSGGGIKGMWRGVILNALKDLHKPIAANVQEREQAKKDAPYWFNIHNKDFIDVCRFAEIKPKRILYIAKLIKG